MNEFEILKTVFLLVIVNFVSQSSCLYYLDKDTAETFKLFAIDGLKLLQKFKEPIQSQDNEEVQNFADGNWQKFHNNAEFKVGDVTAKDEYNILRLEVWIRFEKNKTLLDCVRKALSNILKHHMSGSGLGVVCVTRKLSPYLDFILFTRRNIKSGVQREIVQNSGTQIPAEIIANAVKSFLMTNFGSTTDDIKEIDGKDKETITASVRDNIKTDIIVICSCEFAVSNDGKDAKLIFSTLKGKLKGRQGVNGTVISNDKFTTKYNITPEKIISNHIEGLLEKTKSNIKLVVGGVKKFRYAAEIFAFSEPTDFVFFAFILMGG